MYGKLFRVLIATMTTLVLGATGARAAPVAGWYVGSGGPVPSLGCAANVIGGHLAGDLLADVAATTYHDCSLLGMVLAVDAHLPWQVFPVGQSGTVTYYTIADISMDIHGPACGLEVAGSVNASHDSATGVLTVRSQSTVVTFVDPANACLGLITPGSRLSVLSASYDIA